VTNSDATRSQQESCVGAPCRFLNTNGLARDVPRFRGELRVWVQRFTQSNGEENTGLCIFDGRLSFGCGPQSLFGANRGPQAGGFARAEVQAREQGDSKE
jgi:hypothetical protein